ncbi:MAG: NADP-dependent malic enzyme, partial [Alphaproteobacteria bacterium]|nr:NADP-dependent malic enzyme [Alphaproteobacteria bacterium]
GPLAGKPVMEGKGVLFKKFAGIDVFDIEVAETDPDKLVDIIAALEPTFGGINLEDIKAPECFVIERKLRERMKIPVMHDDQHGTAIIVAAAILNGLRVVGKKIEEVKLVTSGAGAAALACLDLLVKLGVKRQNITATDIAGVVWKDRKELMDPWKEIYAQNTQARTLADVIADADIFMGLSAPNVLKPAMVKAMADKPIILALANPDPEIKPEDARAARPDAIIATGRSDYPNQVNNVLCFPYIFRGALDVGATTINDAMKIACVTALADLAMAESSEIVANVYRDQELRFGPDYLIPKPFDPRLIVQLAPAVAKAAMDSGVAARPIKDLQAYRDRLEQFVFRSGLVMRPVFEAARRDPRRVVYAEGEDERVLRAVQVAVDDGLAKPILIGRRRVVARRIETLGLRIRPGHHIDLVDPDDDPRFRDYWQLYHRIMERKGVTPDEARNVVRSNNTVIACLMLHRGETDAVLCGAVGTFNAHLNHVRDLIGRERGVRGMAAVNAVVLPTGTYFICDTFVNPEPSAETIAEMTVLAAQEVRRFGIVPKAALLSHSNFGSNDTDATRRMRDSLPLIRERDPDLEVEGEMQAVLAFRDEERARLFPNSRLTGSANLLIMPSLDAANIAYNLLRTAGGGQSIGPMLVGQRLPAHILTMSVTSRGIVNMTALAVVDAQSSAAAPMPRL